MCRSLLRLPCMPASGRYGIALLGPPTPALRCDTSDLVLEEFLHDVDVIRGGAEELPVRPMLIRWKRSWAEQPPVVALMARPKDSILRIYLYPARVGASARRRVPSGGSSWTRWLRSTTSRKVRTASSRGILRPDERYSCQLVMLKCCRRRLCEIRCVARS